MLRGCSLIALVALLALATPAHAQVFRYTDDNGNFFYVDGIHNVPERFRSSALPLGPRPAPAPAENEAATSTGAGAATIRYTPGQRIIVDARINGSSSARLLLDTGADRTMIRPATLTAAGVAVNRPVAHGHVTGVAGADLVSLVIVDSLEIGEASVKRLPVVVYDLPHAAGDGLLGRDFLDRFSVNIDAVRGVVTLSPR